MIGKFLHKKGISPLVATVIIIAITVAAGITLYAMVFPLLNKPITQTTCTEVTFQLDSVSSCVDVSKFTTANIRNVVHMSIDRTKSSADEPEITDWTLILDGGQGERRSVVIPSSLFSVPDGTQSTHPHTVDDATLDLLKINYLTGNSIDDRVNRLSAFPTIDVRGTKVTCEAVIQSIERLRICA